MSNFRGGNSSVEQQLIELSRKGDVKELIKLIRDNKKLNLNTVNSLGSTALIEASSKGHVEIVKVLLEKGADVHATRNSGWSALMVASGEGFVSVAQILIDAGADVNVISAPDVGTPFLLACLRGHVSVVQLLLEHGADVHAVNAQDGLTPLMVAAKSGHVDIIRILVEAGSDLNAVDLLGRTAVMWASAENYSDVIEYFIEVGADLTLLDHDSDTAEDIARNSGHYEVADILATHYNPLRDAVEQGDYKRVQRLLREKKNMNLNSTDSNGMTALMIGCRVGHFKIVNVLIHAGAEVNMPDHSGVTPIIEACKQGQEEIIRLLLEYGAHVNAIDTDGESSLMATSSRGYLDLVKLLLEEGADVNLAKYDDGSTALMLASENGFVDIVSLLLEHNADFHATNNKGESASDIAHRCGMEEVESLLSQIQNPLLFACKNGDLKELKRIFAQDPTLDLELPSSDGHTALMVACSAGTVDIAKELISRGANVNASNSSGGTALMDAAWSGYLDVVRLLVEKGANVNAIDDEGGTALMLACKNGHLGVTKVLMDRGANINAVKFDDGWTAIFFASENGYGEIVQLLIGRGANINATDNENWTPLMEACIEGHTALAMILLENGANINASTNDGWTPLMLSCLRGHYDTVVALINEGAQINAVDNERVSALMWASKSGHLDIVKKLVELQADFIMTNALGETAKDIAIKAKKIEVVEYLSTLSDKASSEAQMPTEKGKGSKAMTKIDEKNYMLLDILEGRILMYKSLYDPYCSFVRYPLQYLKDSTDNFRSNFGKGVYKTAFAAIDKTNTKLKFFVKKVTAIKIADESLNLQEEVSALIQARHPNILRVLGYSVNEKFHNEAYLILESIPKYGCLNEFLAKEEKRKILNSTCRCQIICDVAKALRFLHNGGVVDGSSEYIFLHRDLNSSCICVTADFTAKLVLDYDKAVVRLRDEEENPDSSAVVGSPGYTCPRYLRGNWRYQPECDIFSFGVILLEIFTGSLQVGQTSDRSFGEDLVDRYFFSNEKSSFLVKDVDPLAGTEWSSSLSSIAKAALACVDFDPFKRPNSIDLSDKILQVCEKYLQAPK